MKLKSVELEYKENPEIKPTEIQKLLEWIKQQPYLPDISENEAILFFHACKFSMEFTKQTIDINLTLRTHCSDLFSGWNFQSENLQKAMKTIGIFPLTKTTPEGYRVMIGKLCDFDTSNFCFADTIKLYCMMFELWLLEIGTAPGHIIVIDLNGCTLGHITRLGPMTMKKLLYYLQDAAPIRLIGFHYINIVPHTDKIMALIRPLLKKELADSLYLHSKLDTLQPFIPLEIMPKDYGGNDDTSENLIKNTYKNAIENQKFYTNDETRRVNENLRPGKPKNSSTIFGAEGNFKKLDID